MNKKGQALVEFIIIFPIMIMIVLSCFDVANIMKEKIVTEGILEDIILDNNISLDDKYILNSKKNDGKVTYTLSSNVEVICPIVSKILGKNYKVSSSRVVYE